MNMKKLSIVAVSLLLAGASAFAWSKKSENTGNLGRMYISISGAVDSSKADLKVPTNIAPVGGDMKSTPTGAYGQFMINAPIFKPGINAFRNIKWAGVDGQIFFNYDYSGDYKASWTSGGAKTATISRSQYGIFAGLTPYLNFETNLPFLKAVKPFANGYAGYLWSDYDATIAGADFGSINNYFAYGVGAGVEFVIIDELSFTPMWQWNGNAESGIPCYQTVSAELAYWMTDQFCVSLFWIHNFGGEYGIGSSGSSSYSLDVKHGDIIGAKFKIGFLR